MVNHPLASSGDADSTPDWDDPLGKKMASHSSVLAWESPRTGPQGEATAHRAQKGQLRLSG